MLGVRAPCCSTCGRVGMLGSKAGGDSILLARGPHLIL